MLRRAKAWCLKTATIMLTAIDEWARGFVATALRGPVAGLYSTLDNPIEVAVQVAAYELVTQEYLRPGDRVLDVGFGLGYGLKIMSQVADSLHGVEVDARTVSHATESLRDISKSIEVEHYDGKAIRYADRTFHVVTCVDVLEHVADYGDLIREMTRVSKRVVFLSTPNRRPEYTRADGRPKNRWHIREWSYQELDSILQRMPGVRVDWNFLNGPWEGPFECTSVVCENTLALTPALTLLLSEGRDNGGPCRR